MDVGAAAGLQQQNLVKNFGVVERYIGSLIYKHIFVLQVRLGSGHLTRLNMIPFDVGARSTVDNTIVRIWKAK